MERPARIGGRNEAEFPSEQPSAGCPALVAGPRSVSGFGGRVCSAGAPAPAHQISPRQASEEIVATLSAGHVVWCVTRDSILVAAVGGGDEQGSHLPAILPISSFRMGVLLGAVDWNQGSAGKAVRLDAELPQAAANATRRPTKTNAAPDPNEPSDIEQIGVGVLELLRPLVSQLHRKLDLAPNEPLVEVLLADYAENYGPEIWSLKYRIQQDNLGNDYWEHTFFGRLTISFIHPRRARRARSWKHSTRPACQSSV